MSVLLSSSFYLHLAVVEHAVTCVPRVKKVGTPCKLRTPSISKFQKVGKPLQPRPTCEKPYGNITIQLEM